MSVDNQSRSILRGFFLFAVGIVILVVLSLGIRSCVRSAAPALPTEPQTLTGVLRPVPLSLERRGTHLLTEIGGARDVAFVESSTVNLRAFEGLTVEVEGMLEANIDPKALPVLNASGVTLVAMPVRSWIVDAFDMTLDVPDAWDMQTWEDGVRFVQTGTTVSMLMIAKSMLTQFPFGTPMTVGGRPAVAVSGDDAGFLWYVQNGQDILALSVPTSGNPDVASPWDGETYTRLLKSIRFSSASSTSRSSSGSSVPTNGSGAAVGSPCGGPAGILCTEGQYCEVTDTADGVGRCKAMRR